MAILFEVGFKGHESFFVSIDKPDDLQLFESCLVGELLDLFFPKGLVCLIM